MSYTTGSALPGEQNLYRGYLHPIVFRDQIAWYVIAAAAFFLAFGPVAGVILAILLLPGFTVPVLRLRSAEFAVTTQRVILKTGIVRRRVVEILLPHVQAVSVSQSVLGRLLGYGTVMVTGSGGTQERFTAVARPLELRRQIEGAAYLMTLPRA